MLVSALLALSIVQHSAVPYHLLMKTEAKSPHVESATLIQEKRKGFDFLFMIKQGAPVPRSIRKMSWRRNSVIAIYPGLVQKDAKLTLKAVKKSGNTIRIVIDSHRGISAVSYYPIFVLTIPKQPQGTNVVVIDRNRQHMGLERQRHSFGL